MLAAIRKFAKSWVAAVLIGLLIVSFAVFGIRDVFKGSARDAVVVAGSRTVSSAEFKREFDARKADVEQRNGGQPIPLEVAVANGFDRQIVEMIAAREAFAEMLHRMGVRPSDKLIVGEIGKMQAFFDPVSGRFDKKAYQQRLAENGLAVETFEQMMRDQIAEAHMGASVVNGVRAPRAYSALAALYTTEARDIAFFPVNPKSVQQPAPPTDAQLTAFMQENAAQLTRPEYRILTVVRFSPALAGPAGPIDQAEVQKRFDFRKDTLSTPETRTVVQIPAKDQAGAAQAAARLAKGETPAAVAKSLGVDSIVYENKPQTAIPDRRVAAAAFQTAVGQVVPVQGDIGFAAVKVLAATPGKAVTLEQVRPALEAEVRAEAATERVLALTQAYEDAHDKGATLAEAAQKAGVPTMTIGPVSRQGQDPQGQPVAGLTQKLVETAFSQPTGGESEIVDAGQGEYFAVHVDRVIPPAMPPLAEVKGRLSQVWMVREMVKRLQARADELSARIKKGESFDAVAAANGVPVARIPRLSRQTAQQNPNLPPEVVAQAFNSKPGELFTARDQRLGVVVGKLEAVHTGDPSILGAITEAARQQMTVDMFREMEEAARAGARQKLKVKVDYNRARQALGLEPLAETGAAAKTKAK